MKCRAWAPVQPAASTATCSLPLLNASPWHLSVKCQVFCLLSLPVADAARPGKGQGIVPACLSRAVSQGPYRLSTANRSRGPPIATLTALGLVRSILKTDTTSLGS